MMPNSADELFLPLSLSFSVSLLPPPSPSHPPSLPLFLPPSLSVCVSTWGRHRENVEIVLHAPAPFIRKSLSLSQVFLTGLELVKQAKVVKPGSHGIFLFLPPQSWDCKHMLS